MQSQLPHPIHQSENFDVSTLGLSLKKPKDEVDYSSLFNLIIILLMNTVDIIEKEKISNPQVIKKELLQILIDSADKKLINDAYIEKKFMLLKIK